METKQIRDLMEAYASIYTHLSESHYKVGDEVTCKASGMTGKVVKVDPEEKGKYYTVKREDGKEMKYAPEELKKGSEGASKEKEEKFHSKLDKLVHKTFGQSPEEQKMEEVEYFTEEVEIVSEYFYNLGLNEDGMQIVVEELGLDEFYEWIEDIIEDYTLTEESRTRLQKDGALKGPKGSRPQSTTKARIKKQGGTTRMSTDSAPKSVMRKSAVAKAKKSQEPDTKGKEETKKGIGGFIGSLVKRAKQDTELLKKSAQTARDVAIKRGAEAKAVYDAVRARGREAEQSPQATRARRKATVAAGRAAQAAGRTAIKAAGAAGAAAGEGVKARRQGKSGAAIAGRVVGTFARKMTSEEYDYIIEHLIGEGYANTEDSAILIAENMSEGWIDDILEAHPVDLQRLDRQKGRRIRPMRYPGAKPKGKSVGD